MRLSRNTSPEKQKPEPTIALINVVFLMLIFFLIAGTLAPPLDPDLTLVNTTDLEGREPPDALVIHADGSLTYRQTPTTVPDYLAGLQPADFGEDDASAAVRLVPDRDLPAAKLIEVGNSLRERGAGKIFIVTERTIR